jgi:hypothetical protein
VAGTITDHEPGGSGVKAGSAAYVIMDEYGQIQPSGSITLGEGGHYGFTVALEASRRGNDQDGLPAATGKKFTVRRSEVRSPYENRCLAIFQTTGKSGLGKPQ